MIKAVIEILWLTFCQWIMIMLIILLVFKATRVTISTVSALWTRATLWTRTALTLYISFWFRNQNTMRELLFTCLRIYLHHHNGNLVTLFQTRSLNSLKALPVYFRDM